MISKIKNMEELAGVIGEEKKRGKRVVQCHGVFDLLHPGHIRHFEAAKKEGDLLLVTITPDRFANKGPGRPVFNERLRAESIAALHCVDYVAINQSPTAVELIRLVRPDVYVKGQDYANPDDDLTGKIVEEKSAVESVGGCIHFTDDIVFSSTELLNSFFGVYPDDARIYLQDFKKRYSKDDIISMLKSLRKLKVLVVGDTIIDEYYYCRAIGKAQKDSILATKYMNEEVFAGGTLACANHVAGFCDEVHLVTALGKDCPREGFIKERLKPNVKATFFNHDGHTTIKRRFVEPAFMHKMFEICYLANEEDYSGVKKPILSYIEENIGKYDLVLVTDFGHGFFSPELIKALTEEARMLAINTQTNSANTGFNMITKYPRADYICIDEPELRLATHDRSSPIESLIPNVARQLRCSRVTITRGCEGSITYTGDNLFYNTPVFSTKIVDTTGAGDAYLSITSLCVASGLPVDIIGFIGNAVGAMAVQIVCNRSSVEPLQLFKFIDALLK